MRNTHLKNKMLKFMEEISDANQGEESLTEFLYELKVSNLFIPGILEDEDLVYETLILEEEGLTYLPLFTDEDEFYKYYSNDDEYKPVENEFEVYADIADEEKFDGLVINVESESFIVTSEMLEVANADFTVEDEEIELKGVAEIRDAFDSASNDELKKFISDNANADDFEGVFVEMSSANVLNLVESDVSFDDIAEDGVIMADKVDGFNLCTFESDGEILAALFTDKGEISKVIDDDAFYYGQLTVVGELFEFVLRNDMDGVIINPATDGFVIPRSQILSQASGMDLVVEDKSFKNSLEYAFIL